MTHIFSFIIATFSRKPKRLFSHACLASLNIFFTWCGTARFAYISVAAKYNIMSCVFYTPGPRLIGLSVISLSIAGACLASAAHIIQTHPLSSSYLSSSALLHMFCHLSLLATAVPFCRRLRANKKCLISDRLSSSLQPCITFSYRLKTRSK